MSTAAIVKAARQTVEADPGSYDGVLDVAYFTISDTPKRSWTPSEIAQAVEIDTLQAQRVLMELPSGGHITACGNDAWTRFSAC